MSESALQWLRYCSLIVADPQGRGLELSELRVRFNVRHMVMDTPATLTAKVYNLSDTTINAIASFGKPTKSPNSQDGPQVVLNAGYDGNHGVIFQGSIKQMRRGRDNAVDSFLEIMATDGDMAHHWGVFTKTLNKGYTGQDVHAAIARSWKGDFGTNAASPPSDVFANSTPAPRGRAFNGMCRDYLSELGVQYGFDWYIVDNELRVLKVLAYEDGEAVVLSPTTGLIGQPEQTDQGITATCLLNPAVRHGRRVKIDQQFINKYQYEEQPTNPSSLQGSASSFPAQKDKLGEYKCLVVDHVGDTRGNEWYTMITALAVDPSARIPLGVPRDVPMPP